MPSFASHLNLTQMTQFKEEVGEDGRRLAMVRVTCLASEFQPKRIHIGLLHENMSDEFK